MDTMITLNRVEGAALAPSTVGATRLVPAIEPEASTECCMGSLAMAYVPMQKWQELYEPDVALARGTLFAQLDKPFIGEEVRFK